MKLQLDDLYDPVFKDGKLIALIPKNLEIRRITVNGINMADEDWHIPVAQQARHDVSNGIITLATLPGSDDISKALHCVQMSTIAESHQMIIKPRAFHRIIQRLKKPLVSVRPNNRHIGHTLKQIVLQFGGIKELMLQPQDTGLDYPTNVYYFGKSNEEIQHLRTTVYRDVLKIRL